MAVLRTEAGDVVVDPAAIDALIAPCRASAVPVPSGVDDLLDHAPLTDDEHARLLANAASRLTVIVWLSLPPGFAHHSTGTEVRIS